MTYRLPLRVALYSLSSVAMLAPFVRAQPIEAPTPDPTYRATPTPEPVTDPQPSVQSEPQFSAPQNAPASTPALASAPPDIGIGIHETSDESDDMVRVGDTEKCLIRLNNPTGNDLSVVLTSPDDNFSFNGGNTANQLALTLPGDGSTVQFSIIGQTASAEVNNSEIHVHVGYASAPQPSIKRLTVFKLSDAAVNVTEQDNWFLDSGNGNYGVRFGTAVIMRSRISVKPSSAMGKLDADAPQLRYLRSGILQTNATAQTKQIYKLPSLVNWYITETPSGSTKYRLNISSQFSYTTTLPYGANDSANGAPLYARPGFAPESAASLARLLGCIQDGSIAETSDAPQSGSIPLKVVVPVYRSGTLIADVRYEALSKVTDNAYFRTYGVLWNNDPSAAPGSDPYDNRYQPLRETHWSFNMDGSRTTNQHASAPADDGVYKNPQAYDRPLANTLYQDPRNALTQDFGTATVSFYR